MANKSDNLQIVADEEQIARIIFSPSMVNGDDVAPSAFFLVNLKNNRTEDYLSVWRLAIKVQSRENITFKPRKQGDTLFGYAGLSVEVCHTTNVASYKGTVKINSLSPNPYHAGIYYTNGNKAILGECYEPEFIMLASMLATQSNLVVI